MDEMINNTEVVEETAAQDTQKKMFTEDEVAELLQRESDRRVSSALAKQKKTYEQKLSLSRLDDVERERAESKLRIQELEEKLQGYEVEKNRSELKSILGKRNLPVEFADLILVSEDLAESQERIDTIDRLFKTAVANEVKQRLAASGQKPTIGQTNPDELTRESFNKLSLAEKQQLYNSKPELVEKILKG